MSNVSFGIVRVDPSFMQPQILMQYTQKTGAWDLLPERKPDVRLGTTDLVAYQRSLRVSTQTQVGQSMSARLPSTSIVPGYDQMKTYRIACRSQYAMFDEEAARNAGYSLVDANRLAAHQGIAQTMRNLLLYGFDASNNEGVMNSPNSNRHNLPADSHGATGYNAYDNGELFQFLLNEIAIIKSGMMMIGVPLRFTILAPQRFISKLSYGGIVQLTSYQRIGGGSETISAAIKEVTMRAGGDEVVFSVDDTLIGQGAGGTDAIIIAVPELRINPAQIAFDTNIFATLTPNQQAVNTMLCDMAAPMEVVSPIADGGTTTIYTIRSTPGWCLRGQGATILSASF